MNRSAAAALLVIAVLDGFIESFHLGIAENILNESAPDVGFQLGFRKRFGGG